MKKLLKEKETFRGSKVFLEYYPELNRRYVWCAKGVVLINIEYNGSMVGQEVEIFMNDIVTILERAGH